MIRLLVNLQAADHFTAERIGIGAIGIDQYALYSLWCADGIQYRTVIRICHSFEAVYFIHMKLRRIQLQVHGHTFNPFPDED